MVFEDLQLALNISIGIIDRLLTGTTEDTNQSPQIRRQYNYPSVAIHVRVLTPSRVLSSTLTHSLLSYP